MNTRSAKKATSIRLNKDLYTHIEKQASKEHRSINNFIETVLARATRFNTPNKETLEAMEEIERNGDSLKCYPDAESLFENLEK